MASHPGTVAFVAPDGSETVQKADDLPDWVKFAYDSYGRTIPVVLIARSLESGTRIYTSQLQRGRPLAGHCDLARRLADSASGNGHRLVLSASFHEKRIRLALHI
jgi:hypothetical protein